MKVPTAQIINRTKMRLLLTGTTHADAVLEKLINEAATYHLNALSCYVISCETITIDCLKAELPDSCVQVLCYSFPDATGCSGCCATCMNPHNEGAVCSCPTYFVPSREILTEFCGLGASCGLSANFFDVQNGYIVFPSTVTQSTVKVWFRGYNLDEDGLALIDERQERALSAYAAWQYAIAHYKSYAPEQRATWRSEWVAQKNWLRGTDVQADFQMNKAKASSIARALLVNPVISANRNF